MPTGKRIIDWGAIKQDYICGYYQKQTDGTERLVYPTYEELAEKYECAWGTLRDKGGEEKWRNERELRQQKLSKLGQVNSANIDDSTKYDIQNLLRIEKIGQLIDNWLNDKLAIDEEGNSKIVSGKELNSVIDALSKNHQLARNIFGESNDSNNKGITNIKVDRRQIAIADSNTLENIAKIIAARQRKVETTDDN